MGLAARPAQQAQQQPAPAGVHFPLGGNAAQVPAQFIGNLVFLPVAVNGGKPSLFELDSSAAASSIDPTRAAEVGLAGDTIAKPLLDLNGVDVPLVSLSVAAKADFGAQVGRDYEGGLGADFLGAVVVAINYERQTVQLYDPSAFQYSGHGAAFHLTFSAGVPVVQAKIALPGFKPVEAGFAVNTAMDAPVAISEHYAESHDLFAAHVKTIDAGHGDVIGRLREFEMGPYSIERPIAVFSQGNLRPAGAPRDSHLAGEIGGGMLRRFTAILDFPHQRMILEPNGHFADEDEEDKSGLVIVAQGPGLKTFEIVHVQPETPAAEAGIQKGDVIAGIDDEAAADMTLAEVRELFRDVGHKYKLLLERNGQTLEVTMRTRRLL